MGRKSIKPNKKRLNTRKYIQGNPSPCWAQALLSRNILPFSSFGNFLAIFAPSNSYFAPKGFKWTPCEDSITGKKRLNVAAMFLVLFCLFGINVCYRSPNLPTSRQLFPRFTVVQCPGFRVNVRVSSKMFPRPEAKCSKTGWKPVITAICGYLLSFAIW